MEATSKCSTQHQPQHQPQQPITDGLKIDDGLKTGVVSVNVKGKIINEQDSRPDEHNDNTVAGFSKSCGRRAIRVSEGGDSPTKAQRNISRAKTQLRIINRLNLLFPYESKEKIKSLTYLIPAAQTRLKTTEQGRESENKLHDYAIQVRDLVKELEGILDNISTNKIQKKETENASSVKLIALFDCLDSFNLEDLMELCESIKFPVNLTSLLNSKLLKAKLITSIDKKTNGLFRTVASLSDLSLFKSSFEKTLQIESKDDSEKRIFNNPMVMASYVKQQLREVYKLSGTEEQMLENKLDSLKGLISQFLYVDILDIVHHLCMSAKDVTDEEAGKHQVLTLSSLATSIGLSLHGGDVMDMGKISSVEGEDQIKKIAQDMIFSSTKHLETFMEAWPKVKEEWVSKQNRRKMALPALNKKGQVATTTPAVSTLLYSIHKP